MGRRVPVRRAILIGMFVGLALGAQAAFAQQNTTHKKPLVLLTKLTSPQDDIVAQKLASTMTLSLEIVMRMTSSIAVERADFLVPTVAFDRALGYYHQVHADGAVFGSVTPTRGGYRIELGLWNSAQGNRKPRVLRRTITNILSSFSVADSIALEAASTIVGRKLSEGSLVVRNVGFLPRYSVYAGGHLIGRDRQFFHLLTGRWTIIVAKPGVLGDVPVQSFRVDIKQRATAVVALTAPTPAKPAVASRKKRVLKGTRASGTTRQISGAHVYVVGVTGSGHPALWTNGRLSLLPLAIGESSGMANAIGRDAQGNIVIVGSLGKGNKRLPTAWRDGKDYVLSTRTYGGGSATSIAFDHAGNAYIGGSVDDSYPTPAYWKNGRLTILQSYGIVSYGINSAMALDSEGVPHAVGYGAFISTVYATPEYWTNTTMSYLIAPKPYTGIRATGIAVDKHGNAFMSGTTTTYPANEKAVPVVWINNWLEQLPLPKPSAHGGATAVAVDASGNVYVSGYVDSRPVYWVNGQLHTLPDGRSESAKGTPPAGRARSIAVYPSGNVYVTGWIDAGTKSIPALWINGSLHLLSTGTDRTGRALGIAVMSAAPRAESPRSSNPATGRVTIRVGNLSASPGTVRLTITGVGRHIQLDGDGKRPYVAMLRPGVYELRASYNNDLGIGYSRQITVNAGYNPTVGITVEHSTQYRLNSLVSERDGYSAQLHAAKALRKSTIKKSIVFDLLGVSGFAGAGVLAYLANSAYQNYMNATTLSGIVSFRSQVVNDRIFTAVSGSVGLASLIGAILVLHRAPSVARTVRLQNSIQSLDRQIVQLKKSEAKKQ